MFPPCIKNTPSLNSSTLMFCISGTAITPTEISQGNASAPVCTLKDQCGMGGWIGGSTNPNQFWRFLTPIFLHSGIVHLVMNLSFQIPTGMDLERDIGAWRMACIYLLSGIGGFLTSSLFNNMTPSVGCSGALYGLIACLILELLLNWPIIQKPWRELFKFTLSIVFSLGMGMLPGIDNFAHLGGFLTGIAAGLCFLPINAFGRWDRRRKLFFRFVLGVPGVFALFTTLILVFITGNVNCPWCKYLNCIPGMPWCESKWNPTV